MGVQAHDYEQAAELSGSGDRVSLALLIYACIAAAAGAAVLIRLGFSCMVVMAGAAVRGGRQQERRKSSLVGEEPSVLVRLVHNVLYPLC